jgi:hypothetical protein
MALSLSLAERGFARPVAVGMARELSERCALREISAELATAGLTTPRGVPLFSIGRNVDVGRLKQNGHLGLEAFDCHHQ